MRYEIRGTVLPTLEVYLSSGESMYTESGGMAWMKGNIEMTTNTKGGLMKGLGCALAGESLFMTTYTSHDPEAMIVFTPEAPGNIIDVKLGAGASLICQKDAFMCAESTVEMKMHFRKKLGAGFFGGEGFILQQITGPGIAFLEIPGEVREYTLLPNETMKVDPGHIALFEPSVKYDITTVKGLTNVLFGGEGLFLATLTGPGKIWLQSLPLSNLAAKLAKYMPAKSA
ncbi:MAG TPA: TIGR00266 family protein [Anaerolineae bacterium]|nr:TIGR00266 family protein [Anaerolineae bacterium]HQI85024.1 TIGR00266 family protein [Anaerolineae bacterium]